MDQATIATTGGGDVKLLTALAVLALVQSASN
jgi:Flp pilus assembly protein protease CpaA